MWLWSLDLGLDLSSSLTCQPLIICCYQCQSTDHIQPNFPEYTVCAHTAETLLLATPNVLVPLGLVPSVDKKVMWTSIAQLLP